MDAPKKIWVNPFFANRFFTSQEVCLGDAEQYIRADLVDGLVEALDAIIKRWDSPLWKDLPHTATYITRGRAALAALKEEE